MAIDYPQTRRDDLIETLHGRPVADPYRWLEDPDSSETVDWVERQNALSRDRLAALASRDWFTETMTAIRHRPRAGTPSKHGGRYFVSRNDGQQNQNVVFVADSLDELLTGGRVIIDPNTMSADGSTSVLSYTVSDDGTLLAYAASEGGSDWLDFRLLDLATGQPVVDAEIQTKFSVPEWLPDHSYLYCDFDHEGRAAGTQTAALGGAKLRRHRIGDPQQADEVLLEFPEDEQLMFSAEVSADMRFVVVPIVRGTENVNRVWVYRIDRDAGGELRIGEPIRLLDEPDAEYEFIRSAGDQLYFLTDLDAERGRIVGIDLAAFERTGVPELVEVLAESGATLAAAVAAGDLLLAAGLDDASPVLRAVGLDGSDHGRIEVDGGALVALNAEPGESEFFVGMSSVVSPTVAYAGVLGADQATAPDPDPASAPVRLRALPELVGTARPGEPAFGPPIVRTERRQATSADRTAVPYFLISRADLGLDHPRPTLLYGYGGFKIPVLADYRDLWPAWLAAGGVLVLANLRGGGEFGSAWYDAGRLDRKQNVFDDFAAIGEDLVRTGVTTNAQLALHGRSNGGLLVGATMTQHPGLAAAAVPGVGVLDLLRFHKFTIGRAWISDYGDPDTPDGFETALAYSPLHNVAEPGTTRYPATLVLTGDHDDRVVPLHSHKFTAALQYAQAGDAPILTRIETSTGHGAGKPADKAAAEAADLLAFAAEHTGLRPGSRPGSVSDPRPDSTAGSAAAPGLPTGS